MTRLKAPIKVWSPEAEMEAEFDDIDATAQRLDDNLKRGFYLTMKFCPTLKDYIACQRVVKEGHPTEAERTRIRRACESAGYGHGQLEDGRFVVVNGYHGQIRGIGNTLTEARARAYLWGA